MYAPPPLNPMPSAQAVPAHLEALNSRQQEAVATTEGPLLVLAGAGTGKTRVLISRLANILYEGKAYPSQILAVTFTNKAANEMRSRIENLLNHPLQGSWLGTFHSLGVKILREYALLVDLPQNFTIIDTEDQLRLIRQILKAEHLDDKKENAKRILSYIDTWKDRGLTPNKVQTQLNGGDNPEDISVHAHSLYTLYQQRLLAVNAVDFGDLLLHPLTIFTEHPDVLARYQERFKYILVDEYQDTNVAQYLWLRLLAQGTRNICCVGDDDQSIYGWRGAEVQNILKFEKDFPGASVIRLEQNYRSTPHILAAASQLISHNHSRLGKTLWTQQEGGDKIAIKNTWDGREEARWVAEEIEHFQRQKIPLTDCAILVRAGFQTREFEECFLTMGIPHRIVGGFRFYERQEIRDAIAYLRLIHNPNDGLAFERILNVPRRGIGAATLSLLHTHARHHHIPLEIAARQLIQSDEIKGKGKQNLEHFLKDIEQWREKEKTLFPHELAKVILDESGYTLMWKKETSADAPGRLENLKELVRALEDYKDLSSFLEHVSLVMENAQNLREEAVTIMTMHAAKGLEFSYVFLTGWEEGIFPSQNSYGTPDGIEEERRLAYVGLTRAKHKAYISFTMNRHFYGQWNNNPPSRFIEELPAENVEWLPGVFQRPKENINQPNISALSKASSFRKGERIFHQKFGYGLIQNIENSHLTIHFEHTGFKKVLDSFVQKT